MLCIELPQVPTGLQIRSRHYDASNVTVTLAWDAPQGDGVVEHYIISISPPPLSHSMETTVLASPWNVTLNSSIGVCYNASIVAVNCNGESGPLQFDVTASASKYWWLVVR